MWPSRVTCSPKERLALALTTESGMAIGKALRQSLAATGNAAKALHVDASLGTLVTGRAADLIGVEGDPSVRIGELANVRQVIKGGRTVVENGRLVD